MAKALGNKDPTQNLFAVLLQQEAYDVDPKKLSKNPKKNAPSAAPAVVVESAPASAPSHPPTPAEQAQARKQKEEEKKAIAAAQAAAQAEKQKAKAEAEAQGGKNQPKMSREQWELQNKQQKKQVNANENQQDNKQNQGQQNNNDGFQQVRSQNQGQRREYQQGGHGFQQGGQGGHGFQQGGHGFQQGGHGFQQGQDGGGRRGGKEGGERGERGERGGRQGRGDGGREGRGGGRGGRGSGRRGGRSGDQPPRFEQNKNRDFNQRGTNLTGDQRQRGREHDRKSGKFVKNFSNNNVSDFPKVEQEPADWNQQLESQPPTDTGESWTGTEVETANAVAESWEDVNQATGDTTPSATATKDGGKPVEPTPAKVPEPETKSYEDYLKEQEKKRSELQELLEKKEISGFTTRQVVIDKNETGRYVDFHKETDQKPKEEKVKKVKEPKEEKVKKAKIVPLHELGFKMEQQGGYNRRRYNDVRDSQEGGSGEGGENQGEQQQAQGGENRGRGRGRRGGRGGGAGGGRNARSGRQSNRGAFNNNRGNGGNVLSSQPEDWPALVH